MTIIIINTKNCMTGLPIPIELTKTMKMKEHELKLNAVLHM